MRVLVCGGRDYRDQERFYGVMDALDPKPTMFIQGGSNGADYLVTRWAEDRGIQRMDFIASWSSHGKAAGPIRNQQMLDQGKPDLVLAFPGGRGTADMVRRAEAAGVPVRSVPA